MDDGSFEWDDAKAAANAERHGVTFDQARLVFRDAFALDWQDDRYDYGEERFVTIGSVEGRVLTVAYALRGDKIRIISARGAEPHEQRRYHEDGL